MKIAVCLKEVLDARLPVTVEPGSGHGKANRREPVTTLNPADRSALEAAMQLRQEKPGASGGSLYCGRRIGGRRSAVFCTCARSGLRRAAGEQHSSRRDRPIPPRCLRPGSKQRNSI